MKYDCELIQDILSLYKDDALSKRSKAIVEEHIQKCAECKRIYDFVETDTDNNSNTDVKISDFTIKKYSKRIKKIRITIASCIICLMLILASAFISYIKFNTANPFASGLGLIRILVTDTKYVEIQNSPRVILAQPGNIQQTFIDFIESEGYTYLEDEQMGGLNIIEKNGKKEAIFVSGNGYYSKWSWK